MPVSSAPPGRFSFKWSAWPVSKREPLYAEQFNGSQWLINQPRTVTPSGPVARIAHLPIQSNNSHPLAFLSIFFTWTKAGIIRRVMNQWFGSWIFYFLLALNLELSSIPPLPPGPHFPVTALQDQTSPEVEALPWEMGLSMIALWLSDDQGECLLAQCTMG